jgi:hypothetical protein
MIASHGLSERSGIGEIFRGSMIFAQNFIRWLGCVKYFLSFHDSMPRS